MSISYMYNFFIGAVYKFLIGLYTAFRIVNKSTVLVYAEQEIHSSILDLRVRV